MMVCASSTINHLNFTTANQSNVKSFKCQIIQIGDTIWAKRRGKEMQCSEKKATKHTEITAPHESSSVQQGSKRASLQTQILFFRTHFGVFFSARIAL